MPVFQGTEISHGNVMMLTRWSSRFVQPVIFLVLILLLEVAKRYSHHLWSFRSCSLPWRNRCNFGTHSPNHFLLIIVKTICYTQSKQSSEFAKGFWTQTSPDPIRSHQSIVKELFSKLHSWLSMNYKILFMEFLTRFETWNYPQRYIELYSRSEINYNNSKRLRVLN